MENEYHSLSFRDFEGNARKILGVGDFAGIEEIQKAFRALSLRYHPDRCGSDPECIMKFRAVVAAQEWLSKGRVNKANMPLLESPESLGKTRSRETYLDWWKRTFFDDVFPLRLESHDGKARKKRHKKEKLRFPL